jgi:cytochrome P450
MAFIHDAQESDSDYPTLLSNLMNAKYEDGSTMGEKQLRDEVMTVFLAGHDTTAITLSATFYLLSQHPDIETQMVTEIQQVLSDGPLSTEHLERLVFTKKNH